MTPGESQATAPIASTTGSGDRVDPEGGRQIPGWAGDLAAATTSNLAIIVFLIALFIGRFLLADWNSYWNDEILSVVVYGIQNESAIEAVRTLANNSIHPPLYQFILYNWMSVFGDSEVATRTLSNVYVTLAALLLYFFVRNFSSRTVAFFASAGFSLMSLPTYYALESRSYAQTIFLVCLSSWALISALSRMRRSSSGALRPQIWLFGLVAAANTSLLLTHYYNVFWLLAQAAFLALYLVVEWPRTRWRSGVGTFFAVTLTPPAVFALAWGGVFVRQYANRAPAFQVEEEVQKNPLDLLLESLVEPNIIAPWFVIGLLGLAVAACSIAMIARLFRTREREARLASWSFIYLAGWLVLPLIVVFVVFSVVGVERYSARYFVFSIPALSALVVISLAWLIARLTSARFERGVSVITALVISALVLTLFVPGALDSATSRKHDWRGTVQQVINVVRADPDREYLIVESSFSSALRANYYFERLGGGIRADIAVSRAQERNASFEHIDEEIDLLDEDARVIVIFNHHRAVNFPEFLEHLDSQGGLVHAHVNRMGRGYIVFDASAEE